MPKNDSGNMQTSIQNLYFLLYTILALGLAVAAIGVSVSQRRERERRQRGDYTVWTAASMLPVFAAVALGSLPGMGPLLVLAPILPVLCVTAIHSNYRGVKGCGLSMHFLTLPILLWNLALFTVYTVRGLHVLSQIELGSWGSGLLTTFAMLQRNIGGADAETLPVFLYLPLIIPPMSRASEHGMSSKALGSFVATFMLAVFICSLPGGFGLSLTQRRLPGGLELSPRGDISLTMDFGEPRADIPVIGLLDWLGNTADVHARVGKARSLNLTNLEFRVRADIKEHERQLAELSEILNLCRSQGIEPIVIVQLPLKWRGISNIHPRKFLSVMQEAHWLMSERFEPELLVLFDRPFKSELRDMFPNLGVEEWAAMIQESLKDLKDGRPKQKTAVDLAPPDEKAKRLFAILGSTSSLVDEVRFFMAGTRVEDPALISGLLAIGSWVVEHPTPKRLSLVGSPPAPLGFCGFKAQSFYVERLMAFANRHPLFSRLCLGPMVDSCSAANGYWNSRDIARPVLRRTKELLIGQRGIRAVTK